METRATETRSPLTPRDARANAARDATREGATTPTRWDDDGAKTTTTTTTTTGKKGRGTARGEENTPPVSARTRGRRADARRDDGGTNRDDDDDDDLNAAATARRERDARRTPMGTTTTTPRGTGSASRGKSPLGSAWREEMARTRERLARSRALSMEKTTASEDGDSETEDVDAGDVVVALERRLEATTAEGSVESPSRAAAVEVGEGSAATRAEDDDDEGDESACATPNVDDPQVAMAIERVRLVEERKTKETARKLVAANENAARLKARLHELELRLDDKENELEASDRRVQGAVKEAVRDVWAKMDAANAQCVKAETERCAAQVEAQEARRELIELETRLRQSERELSASRANHKSVQDDMAKLRELAAGASEIEAEELCAELDAARAEIEQLEARLEEVQEAANEKVYYETENQRLERENEDLERELTWRKAGEVELRAALERSESEVVLHRAESSKSESDVYAMIEAKNAELDEMRRSLSDAERRLAENAANAAKSSSELEALRRQNIEFEKALQSVTVDGSSKRYELEKDFATAMNNIHDLTRVVEETQYELKQARVEKDRAIVEAQEARRAAAEASSVEEYKIVDLTTELESALEHCAHLQQELATMREREQDLLSQLDDVIIAAQLAEEETEVDIEDVSESEDPHSPSPMKNARARASSSGSRKMNVANLVATNRDLVDMASRQSNEISRLQAERSKLRAELTKSEAALARLTKFKDENLALACKYKANLQKTSDEIKARQLVESRLHEYEHTARALEETVEQLRSELSRASERRTEAASMKESSEIENLRDELSEMKRSLNAVQMEKKTMLEELSAQLKEITVASRQQAESTQPRDEDVHETSFADYLAHEAAEAEAAMQSNDLYAQRLDEEIAKVEREMRGGAAKPPKSTPTRSRDASPSPIQRQNVIDTAKEATQVALDVCESTKQRAMYYKGVAKMVYGKLQTQKASYDAKLAALKLKLDAVVTAPATPSLKTPLSAIAREHSFLLDT